MDESFDKQPIRAKQPKQLNGDSASINTSFKNKKLSNSEIALLTMNN